MPSFVLYNPNIENCTPEVRLRRSLAALEEGAVGRCDFLGRRHLIAPMEDLHLMSVCDIVKVSHLPGLPLYDGPPGGGGPYP